MRRYVESLLCEMDLRRGEQMHPISTVYFGGGTPSILPIELLARIVDGMNCHFDLSMLEEMTIEANPEDLTLEYLASLKSLGFNRLSIGIQSLDDNILRLLNRRHTAQQAIEAVENAHSAGFDNISVDFIYGLPVNNYGLSQKHQLSIINYQLITHISAYALTVEQGTALAKQVEQGRVVLLDEDEVVRQYRQLHNQLSEAGFEQYEVSNYARPGFESKHNSRYWDRTPYLGLGPGAHSFDGTRRRWNIGDVQRYISGTCPFEEETLTPADAYNELLMTALRTTAGLPMAAVHDAQRESLRHSMQPYIDCGWIIIRDNHYIPTEEGLLHTDGLAASLFV